MKDLAFLALDCTSDFCSMALSQAGHIHLRNWHAPLRQLTRLVPEIDGLLARAGLSYQDLSAVSVTAGPGSYTGLRLGLVTAKTLAQTLAIPLYSYNTLDIMAYNACGTQAVVAPLLDARKGEIFTALYACRPASGELHYALERLSDYLAFTPEALRDFLNAQPKVILLGNALQRYASYLEAFCRLPVLKWYPKSAWMNLLSAQAYREGIEPGWQEAQPFYMRLPDAKEPCGA